MKGRKTMVDADLKHVAKRAIGHLDLTNLNDMCSEDDIDNLCGNAITPFGNVAAVCIWPGFVAQAVRTLAGSDIRIATVINFPDGREDTRSVVEEAKAALACGADEIDLVFPYRAFLRGERDLATNQIRTVRQSMPDGKLLKVILETGELQSENLIREASKLAIAAGADFIKTSTGKVAVNATPEAARMMLEEIRDACRDENGTKVGFKPAGGMKTTEDAANYLALADEIMGPDWATPNTLRFGASSVLADLLATLDGTRSGDQTSSGDY